MPIIKTDNDVVFVVVADCFWGLLNEMLTTSCKRYKKKKKELNLI